MNLRGWVGDQLSPIAKPDDIRLTDNLPKTRSGKIMRRLLRAIARGEEITQDMSTLENPAILDQLRGRRSAAPQTAGEAQQGRESQREKRQASLSGLKAKTQPKAKSKKPKRTVEGEKTRLASKAGQP